MIRTLIVDDHLIFIEALSNLVSAQGDFEVVGQACSVEEAVRQARSLKPDLILMDFLLEDGTGLDATQEIIATLPAVKIVFLTAHDDDQRLFEAIRYGAVGYLLKNIPASEMLAYLRGLNRGEIALQPALATRIVKEFAKMPVRPTRQPEEFSSLTDREMEVMKELENGATNRQIAKKLVISEQTVKNHVSQILKKLHIKDRRELSKFSS
jgi:DNA-binding NarL/FixJ family response regulator